ncbi:PhzF family phenazine biosynthesis isomerase [Enterococcus larvae]|uniref:PhzF family phenazine biosynthesis isomerase n=1 Tax=Enterococcus larvae TaxID=2794352 RepID=UPI003F2E22A2
MDCLVVQVDAFTKQPGLGNPAGVILNGDDYSSEEMQQIAKKVGFNECVFVCESQLGDVKLRYFTPGHETPLCGHATMGAIYLLSQQEKQDRTWLVETQAGLITVNYLETTEEMTMEQSPAQFVAFDGEKEALCEVMGIAVSDLDAELPILYGNTGSWTLIVPVRESSVLDKMVPQTENFPDVLKEMPKSSIHPFAFSNIEEDIYTARHFSSPFSGTVEDSVTGTASGVMGAYLLDHVYQQQAMQQITVLQGKHVEKEGSLTVQTRRVDDGHHHVAITGTACKNQEFSILI